MTPQQQRDTIGISAEAHDGHVIVEMDRTFMMLTPKEIQRFDHFLHRAYRDATIGRDRGRTLEPAR